MNSKIHFIWEAKNIDEHFEEIYFSELFHDYMNNCPLLCGKFDREVSISNVKVKVIHFTDFRLYNSGAMTFIIDNNLLSLNLKSYVNLTFQIIEPGNSFIECFIKLTFHINSSSSSTGPLQRTHF